MVTVGALIKIYPHRIMHSSMQVTVQLTKLWTRNTAIADKPRDAFRGQSRSPNTVPFHMLGMVSY